MRYLDNYGDSRLTGFCVFCGGVSETRDHIPSKVFLDTPYPENLYFVPACLECNNSFSLDEEYLACLIECVACGSTSPDCVTRPKIQRILTEKPQLASRIEDCASKNLFGETIFMPEWNRVLAVIKKLAQGHIAYENNEPQLENPPKIFLKPLDSMKLEERNSFETIPSCSAYPEVGTRLMQRLFIEGHNWIVIQPGRYRYVTMIWPEVRIVIGEYLAAVISWEDDEDLF